MGDEAIEGLPTSSDRRAGEDDQAYRIRKSLEQKAVITATAKPKNMEVIQTALKVQPTKKKDYFPKDDLPGEPIHLEPVITELTPTLKIKPVLKTR